MLYPRLQTMLVLQQLPLQLLLLLLLVLVLLRQTVETDQLLVLLRRHRACQRA